MEIKRENKEDMEGVRDNARYCIHQKMKTNS